MHLKNFLLENFMSVEMIPVIALLSFPLVVTSIHFSSHESYKEPYQGFDSCGINGWSCSYVNGRHAVTYECSESQPNARVWVWTARLPSATAIFIVKNCKHLEVHMDCTKGSRNTILRQFNVINVTILDILPPTLPGSYLHDNDEIPQAPPVLDFLNVTTINFYSGVFDKPGGGCRNKYVTLTNLTLTNVGIEKLPKDLFKNQNMDKIVFKNVNIKSIEKNSMSIICDMALMVDCKFPDLPSNSIQIKSTKEVLFYNNTFEKIQSNGLSVKTKLFRFLQNSVNDINGDGLEVLGAYIEIIKNVFYHLETGALEKISFSYSPQDYEMLPKFLYEFSNNTLDSINPGSLHPNWESYKHKCSEIIVKNNKFDCSCINLGWVSMPHGLGPKISKVKEFYDLHLNTYNNSCKELKYCPLKVIIDQMQDICNNKTSTKEICNSDKYLNLTEAGSVSDVSSEMTLLDEIQEVSERVAQDWIELTEKIPVYAYTENQTSQSNNEGGFNWLMLTLIIVVCAALSVGLLVWWFKRKNQRKIASTIYKNHHGNDGDSLIVINEHSNELFDKN